VREMDLRICLIVALLICSVVMAATVNITNTQYEEEEYPSWSPNGSRIAFVGIFTVEDHQIYTIPANGGPVTQLTFDSCRKENPVWSYDSSKIAFTGETSDNYQIFVVPAMGGPITQITSGGLGNANPTWSPDGRYIAFCHVDYRDPWGAYIKGSLWKIEIATGEVSCIVSESLYDGYDPDWSSDQKWIFYKCNNGGFMITAEGFEKRQLPGTFGYSTDLSPDGSKVAYYVYSSQEPLRNDIFINDLTTGKSYLMTNDEYSDINPSWSPDGKKIVYQSSHYGQYGSSDLFVRDLLFTEIKSWGQIKAMYKE